MKSEWYVLLNGYGTSWIPVAVVLGRQEALTKLTTDFPVTPDEYRRLQKYHATEPRVGDTIHLVGHYKGRERVLDRKLTRVEGPSVLDV